MKLDRALQKQLLTKLSESYPEEVNGDDLGFEPEITANLFYLREHGLISGQTPNFIGREMFFISATITANGMDFLADDGGLTAILGVVTIKLHEDTLLRLIEARVESSDLAPEEKNGLMKSIRELPGDAIKHLTEKLIDAGLENWPAALPLIQRALGGLL
ncbi:hypothetical protein GJ698_15000 [Pseudoduganella sp. FT26W]|uniref:Uncharacterized protein n=1 Tax=Duganella aquatilis TaxID=2666082 RepID=A0A844D9G3_9BURK|nr:hypothetical protein [Duganella aquatilis]MRW85392.1 hypothetical protein [Duganella aquatilis]